MIGESKSNYGILSIVGNGSISLAGIYEFIDFITLPGILSTEVAHTCYIAKLLFKIRKTLFCKFLKYVYTCSIRSYCLYVCFNKYT